MSTRKFEASEIYPIYGISLFLNSNLRHPNLHDIQNSPEGYQLVSGQVMLNNYDINNPYQNVLARSSLLKEHSLGFIFMYCPIPFVCFFVNYHRGKYNNN